MSNRGVIERGGTDGGTGSVVLIGTIIVLALAFGIYVVVTAHTSTPAERITVELPLSTPSMAPE